MFRQPRESVPGAVKATAAAPSPVLSKGNGPVLNSVKLHLIYWGSPWASQMALRQQLESAVKSILSSKYVTELSEYGSSIGAGTLAGTHECSWSTPENDFSTGDDVVVQAMITDMINRGALPPPTDSELLYVVLPPPGVTAPKTGNLGQHWIFTYTDANNVSSTVHYAWVAADVANTYTGSTLGDFTWTLSHEIVESITDPEMTGWTFDSCPGVNGTCEIADVCNGQFKLADGTVVQDWYSVKNGKKCYFPK